MNSEQEMAAHHAAVVERNRHLVASIRAHQVAEGKVRIVVAQDQADFDAVMVRVERADGTTDEAMTAYWGGVDMDAFRGLAANLARLLGVEFEDRV